MTDPTFATRREALEAKWFSRRHETGDANREAREKYQAKAKPAARIARRARRLASMEEAA